MKSILVRIEGKVQGVWYRGWTVDNAQELGLNGWVRNRRDGTVEAVFCGDEKMIEEMLLRCQHGPDLAVVKNITSTPCEKPERHGFQKLETC